MIARAVSAADPRTMTPEARLAEVAQLLARAFVRANVAHTARPVANVAPPAADAAPTAPTIPLALSPPIEPSCSPRERRKSRTHLSPTNHIRKDDR